MFFLISAGPTGATIIDFTTGVNVDNSTNWSSQTDWTNVGLTFTILGGLGTVDTNANLSRNLYHNTTDGLGIKGADAEYLLQNIDAVRISFSVPIVVSGVWVLNLGEDTDLGTEKGRVNFFLGGTWLNPFSAPNDGGNLIGEADNNVFFAPGNIVADTIVFRVPPGQLYSSYSEYSIAKVDVNPVPEPATMLLLGSGLIGVGAFVRRKFKK
jgi:hypothetical protein